ncbi:MAG: M20/M25/M40 family metallo-hydrolase [SAR202 cluster bacterium]|nr:M20/M25/M40 family metallo-hydrolase [SAR202 cluster bacterium]
MPSLQTLLDQVDRKVDEIVALHRSLVRIPTVNTGFMPTGNETAAAEFIRDWLANEKVESSILGRDPDRGNLIAVVPGRQKKTRLMLMSHTDVVPVENESKWKHEPFSATVAGGRVYGRGASDCKALLASQLMAVALLKRNGIRFEHGFRLVAGADEEHGGRWGFGWLADKHPETLESEFAVNEGGGTAIEMGGAIVYLLGVGEKGRLEVHIRFKGESAHASVPWTGKNASYGLSEALKRIESYTPELDTSLPLFDHLSEFAIEDRPTPKNIDRIIADLEPKNRRLATLLRALSRMTLTPTMIKGGIKSNSVPEMIELTCDVRTLPFQNDEYLRKQLDDVLKDIPDIEYDIDYMSVPNQSPFDTELATSIKKAQALAIGRDDIRWAPMVSNGFTDSRFPRNLGIVTYGWTGVHPTDDPTLTNAHGTNESTGILSLVSATKAMMALTYDLCGGR